MPITQQDIARRVKVSRSLVGQVLSGRPGNFVSDGTKQLILRTAREMNYHPNASALALRTGVSKCIGLYGVSGMSELSVNVCAEVLSAAKYELKVKDLIDRDSLLAALTESARGGFCDAYLVSGMYAEEQGVLLESLGVPFAAYGRFEKSHPNWLQVDYDHEAMMANAVRRLADGGRLRPVMACFDTDQTYIKHLIAGFKDACASQFGIAMTDDMILKIPVSASLESVIRDTFDRWMSMPESVRPDCLVMGSEFMITRVIEEQLWRYGMRIGFGDGEFSICGACHPPYGWLVGDYVAFDRLDSLIVARRITEDLILPMLAHNPIEQTTIRVIPGMHELSGMKLDALKDLAALAAKT